MAGGDRASGSHVNHTQCASHSKLRNRTTANEQFRFADTVEEEIKQLQNGYCLKYIKINRLRGLEALVERKLSSVSYLARKDLKDSKRSPTDHRSVRLKGSAKRVKGSAHRHRRTCEKRSIVANLFSFQISKLVLRKRVIF